MNLKDIQRHVEYAHREATRARSEQLLDGEPSNEALANLESSLRQALTELESED